MPTYEYRCEKGHVFEEFQSMLADPIQTCPICGSHADRVISGGTGLIFKGSGFYITDYAHKNSSGGRSKPEKSHSSESAETTPAPAPKTETASEPKTVEKKDKPKG